MKKVNLFLAYSSAFTMLFSSCKDDIKEMEAGKTEIPTQFSNYTAEQNKTNLEDNGIALMDDLSDLKSSSGVETSATFVNFLDRATATPANGRIMRMARTLKSYHDGKGSVHDIFTTMRMKEEEPESIQELFDAYIGVYTWNSQTEDWDYVKEGDRIVFKFPATETGTSNNASFIIHSYTGVDIPNSMDEDYKGDLPTQLITELQIDGKKEVEYKFNAAYNQEGEPTHLTTSLMVNTFIFSVSAENNTENVGVAYSLKKGEKNLISMGAGAKGKFTAQHIKETENSESGNVGDVANEVNAYFQLMDIKIAGGLNIKNFADGQDEIYGGSDSIDFNYDKAIEKEAALLNENFNLVVFYASSKEKIADTEVYTFTDSYIHHEPEYDESGNYTGYKEVEEPYTAMDIRMIFADDSKSDLETYFSDGFDDLNEEISMFVNDVEDGSW